MQPKLGIIAGGGSLPRQIIDICRETKRDHYVIAIEGHALPELLSDTPHSWIRIGTAGRGFKILQSENVIEIVMIGDVKVPSFAQLRPDFRTAMFFLKVMAKSFFTSVGDNKLLTSAADELEREGFKVIGVDEVLDDLLAPEGVLGDASVDLKVYETDIQFGIQTAQQLGERDVGQAVIVKSGQVVIEEDKAGTTAMIKRSKSLIPNAKGGLLIKVKKPGQDRRMDLPTIGVTTITEAKDAGIVGIVIQAGETIIVDKEAVVAVANECGVFIKSIRLEEGTKGAT